MEQLNEANDRLQN
jgi:hypothetical protein